MGKRAGILALLCGALWSSTALAQQAATLNLATYNVRLDTAQDGVNAWPHRKAQVMELVRYHEFDVFATQEALPGQVDELAGMQEYAYVGAGRDDGKRAGEHAAIFFRRARFELLRNGDFWLSETPDRPSMGWDARCCKRIVSWAELRDRESGIRFFFFSAHFDHEGEVARRESAKLLLAKVRAIAGDAPVVCAGDFNSTPDTGQMATMRAGLRDAYLVSVTPPYGPTGTFNGFKIDAPLTDRIDYIFVSPHVKILRYAALTDSRYGRYPSDHLPVLVRAQITAGR
ncbi:MAG TPA: endonuclease/exonuclease/phosphatase family protein [Telluria sp.]|nr:endonuclease/exonuclease/phosphatase family protein [Telluria sp.]